MMSAAIAHAYRIQDRSVFATASPTAAIMPLRCSVEAGEP